MHCTGTSTLREEMTHRYMLHSTKAPRNGSCAVLASNEAPNPDFFTVGDNCAPIPTSSASPWNLNARRDVADGRSLDREQLCIILALIASGSGAGKGAAFAKYHHAFLARDVAFH